MGEVIQFRPKSLGPWTGGVTPASPVPPRAYDTGPLTRVELIRVEELLAEARNVRAQSRELANRGRQLPSVFTNASPGDEPMLPCPLTDVSWLDCLDHGTLVAVDDEFGVDPCK